MEIPFYDNEASSSEEETCGILDNTSNNPALQTLDKEMYLSWELDDNVYEDNEPDEEPTSIRKRIHGVFSLSDDTEGLYGYIKRVHQSKEVEQSLREVNRHTNEIYNPFLNNIQHFESVRVPNTVYIDANDPNIIFASELPSTDNGVVSKQSYRSSHETEEVRVQTRVILNPPFHSNVAREFMLVQGGLTRDEMERFHRPSFPPREIELNCEIAKPQSQKRDALVHSVRSINDLSTTTDHLILIEYVEPQPPVFLNQGMGAYIINWINPDRIASEYPKPIEGYNRVLQQREKMPLMGLLKKGESQLTLCTSLYNTPIYHHTIPSTDYLLTVKIENPREPSPPTTRVYSATIRKIDNLFVAGKMEPIARVFQPYDDNYNETTTSLENYLLQQYFKKMNEKLSREQMCSIFPYLRNEEERKDFEERHRPLFIVTDHIYRSKNNLPISIPRYLTPESVCLLQSCLVSHYLLKKAGIQNIFSFSNTSGTQYLRDKENIKIIYDEIHNKYINMNEKKRNGYGDSMCEENCTYKLASMSYQRMDAIINRERMASEFFVERIYRTSWNLTHHYINSIIEGKDRLELTTSNYFTDVLFSDAFGEDFIFLCNKTLRNRKGTTGANGKVDEEGNEEGGSKGKNSNDLRQLNKKELIDLAVKLGMQRDVAETEKRWPLVQFIARNSYNERPDLYRDQKHNQQQLNQEFLERIQYLFTEQREKLQKTEITPVLPTSAGIAVNMQHTDFRQLRSLDHPDDITHNVLLGGMYFQDFNENDMIIGHDDTQRPIGAQGGYLDTPTGFKSPRGTPLLVRHISIKVSNKGVAEITGYYTRNVRDIKNTIETEKRMSYPNLPLSALLLQYNRFDVKKAATIVKKKIQTTNTQKSVTKRTVVRKKKSKEKTVETTTLSNEETNPRKLTTLLSKILDSLEKKDVNKSFRLLPIPNSSWAENYRKVITNIIDFSILRKRIRKFGYTHLEILEDIHQLYENTATFNGAENELTLLAKQFVDDTEKYVEENIDAFRKAEEQLQPPEVPDDIGPNPYENA